MLLVHWYRWMLGYPPQSLGLRQKASFILNASPLGLVWDQLQVAGSLASCFLYVASSYDPTDYAFEADILLVSLFIADYAIRLYADHGASSLWYPFTLWGLVDAVAILPSVLGWGGMSTTSFSFVRFFRVFRTIRVLRIFRTTRFAVDPAQKQMIVVILTLFSMLFIQSSLLNLTEKVYYAELSGSDEPNDIDMTFGNALYL